MNSDELNDVWNSPANDLTEGQRGDLADHFAQRMIRRRRFRAVHLITTGLMLAACLVGATWSLVNGNLDMEREWAVLPLLILPCAFYAHFVRRFFSADEGGGEFSISQSLRRSLASVRRELAHLRCVGVLLAVNVPVLVVAVGQLRSSGKMTPRETGMMALGVALALGVGAGVAVYRYFARLMPERKRLEELLREEVDAGC